MAFTLQAIAWLPTLTFTGHPNPVVQVVDEAAHEVVYTLRVRGNNWRPKVFREGKYTIHIDDGKTKKTLTGVKSVVE